MENRPKVSILIPVYNTAKYLPKCMESVRDQTLKEIEIIAVNDASPDNAAEVLAEYAAEDHRVKVITHEKNGGILAARLSGIAAAKGEFLIFLDADDYLDTDTARACYAKARKTGADMIHFCFDVRVGHRKKTIFARRVERRINPYRKPLLGRKVFEGAFVDYLYSWNICGKFIAADVCRKAAASLPPGYYIMAEDFCFYTMLAWYSSHYEPLFKKCYHYGLDIGVSNYGQTDYQGFLRNCTVFTALKAVKSFLKTQGAFEIYQAAFEEQERRILDELMERWEQKLIRYDRIRILSFMFENYPAEGLLRSIISYFAGREDVLAGFMGRPEVFMRGSAPAEVRHIGLYLENAVAGTPLTEQLLLCAGEWEKAGLRVTVICPSDDLPALPAGMDRICIPGALSASSVQAFTARNGFWFRLRAQYGIDTVVHGAVGTSGSLFDILAVKQAGMHLVAAPLTGIHMLADSSMGHFLVRMRSFQIADALAVQTEQDRAFFSSFGIRCGLLSMPGKGKLPGNGNAAVRKQLLWLGHFGDPEAEIALSAWAKIAPDFPDYRLCMAGRTPDGVSSRCVMTLADKMNLGDSVTVIRQPADFLPALSESSLFFMTSGETDVPLYADAAEAAGIPCYRSGNRTPEELAAELSARLRGDKPDADAVIRKERVPARCCGLELFRRIEEGPPEAREPMPDLLEVLSSCRLNFEPYVLQPENRGATFIQLYRKVDRFVYRLLPPASRSRDFVYRACRYVLNRIQKRTKGK